MTIDVATGISRILKQEGVGWVSTFPVCRVNNALGREGVPMLMMRDDRYAVAVADAFSRITAGSRIGVCTFQGGVNAAGMQYAYAGMAQAYEDGSPVLCITDGVPAGSSGNSQYDVASAMKTVSKWFGYLDKPERTPELMRRAFTMLRSGRPGPVILAIPNATATYDETADPYRPVKGWKSAPDPADVRAAVDQLLKARNPLIYAGEGVIYAGASEDLKALAELVNVPVITTLKAKGAFPENHPLFVGVRGDQVAHYLNKSDLILAVGSSLSPGRFSHAIPDAAKKTIIHCNVDELHINKMYPTAHAVIGDARLTLQALRQEVSDRTSGAGRTAGNVAAEVRAARDEALARYRQVMVSDDDAPGLCLDGCVDAVEVRELGAIALDRRGIAADRGDSLIQLELTSASYEDSRAFLSKAFGDAEANAGAAARHQCDFACELACHRELSFGLRRARAHPIRLHQYSSPPRKRGSRGSRPSLALGPRFRGDDEYYFPVAT